jgi:hypothetical protein
VVAQPPDPCISFVPANGIDSDMGAGAGIEAMVILPVEIASQDLDRPSW